VHIYLRAIGFSDIDNKEKEIQLLKNMEQSPSLTGLTWMNGSNAGSFQDRQYREHDSRYAEIQCEVGEGMGVILHGYRRPEDGVFVKEFYYPYMEGQIPVEMENIYIRRRNDREAFSVLSEEYPIGSTLIFYLTNGMEWMESVEQGKKEKVKRFTLTGMCIDGKILLPIQKTERQIARQQENTQNRNRMIEAARSGDENAMESLTMDDINTYGQISRRIMEEDIYSIVDSSFMPSGVECDNYSVVGDILQVETVENRWTGEKVYRMVVCCNGVHLTICINEKDLLGEPREGRRFKGDIWLQGIADFTSTF
jgi:hypothetical protein